MIIHFQIDKKEKDVNNLIEKLNIDVTDDILQ
jgi:hypothetical protein